jgi:plastocyanin domain-containing protein
MNNFIGCVILALFCSLAVFPRAVNADEQAEVREYTAAIDPDGVQRVSIMAGEFYFDPNHIIVKVNVPVELSVAKEPGLVPHDMVMKSPEAGMEFDVEISTSPKTVAFTPTQVGKYPLYCSKKMLFFESHRDKGMEGVLEVRE